jgi:hypothetical protein
MGIVIHFVTYMMISGSFLILLIKPQEIPSAPSPNEFGGMVMIVKMIQNIALNIL